MWVGPVIPVPGQVSRLGLCELCDPELINPPAKLSLSFLIPTIRVVSQGCHKGPMRRSHMSLILTHMLFTF